MAPLGSSIALSMDVRILRRLAAARRNAAKMLRSALLCSALPCRGRAACRGGEGLVRLILGEPVHAFLGLAQRVEQVGVLVGAVEQGLGTLF